MTAIKNVYGYKSFLDVPIPVGEKRIDIRVPKVGERILSADCQSAVIVTASILEGMKENLGGPVSIILEPKPEPPLMTITVEIPYEMKGILRFNPVSAKITFASGINKFEIIDAKIIKTEFKPNP